MGPGTPYAIAAKFAHPGRPVIALVGDGVFQMNGLAEMITVKRYKDRLSDGPLIFCVFNNEDLNQVTWEQRAMGGEPKFEGSQYIPDVPYAEFAKLLGLTGIRCDDPKRSARPGTRRWRPAVRWCWRWSSTRTSRRSRRTSRR